MGSKATDSIPGRGTCKNQYSCWICVLGPPSSYQTPSGSLHNRVGGMVTGRTRSQN